VRSCLLRGKEDGGFMLTDSERQWKEVSGACSIEEASHSYPDNFLHLQLEF
jgi:hypothetical protein